MKRILVFLLLLACCTLQAQPLKAVIDSTKGTLVRLEKDGRYSIPFREDFKCGPGFEGLQMSRTGEYSYGATRDSISYTVDYEIAEDELVVRCSITNLSSQDHRPDRERFYLGVNSEMERFPDWNYHLFPTLLRCEKDFAWGYFSSPTGLVLAFATEDPVASYGINYIYEEEGRWDWGHRIHTACLDLIHRGPLPERHPQDLDTVPAGRRLSWTIHMGVVDGLEGVKPAVARWSGAPMIECDAYTVAAGTKVGIGITSTAKPEKAVLTRPSGKTSALRIKDGTACTGKLRENGEYTLRVTAGGKTSEAKMFVREDWEWYSRRARDFQYECCPPRISGSCETFYGFYPAFDAAANFPSPETDAWFKDLFFKQMEVYTGPLDGPVLARDYEERLQNFSSICGMFVSLWKATGDSTCLRQAGRFGDYVAARQDQTGALKCYDTHYTAVIYPAKSLFELADAEQEAGLSEEAARHRLCAERACLDLLARGDDIETEGDMTFEDGMITCSALQMGFAALHTDDADLRKAYTEAAAAMMEKHRCLEQDLIPDCRMRGATERFWEALDIYFIPNQVMNSPHGWTAWKIYAVYYLYLLTGDVAYLEDLMDTLGAGVQTMALDGHLRWGFIPDPFISGWVLKPGEEERTTDYDNIIIGEQYMELISTWCKPEDPAEYTVFGQWGGGGDGTVYEIYRALNECVLHNAFVVVDGNGGMRCWNCKAKMRRNGEIKVSGTSPCVTRAIVNRCGEITFLDI